MTSRSENKQSALKRRIRQFYDLLNQRDFDRCHQIIDPRIRLKSGSITLVEYEDCLRKFLDVFGSVQIVEISVNLHLKERSELYDGRDFAVGKTTWEDDAGGQHVFSERWVWEGRAWYTRSTGFVVPTTEAAN